MLEFKKITIEDKELLQSFYENCSYESCEYSAGIKLFWNSFYPYEYAVSKDGALIVKYEESGNTVFDVPVLKTGEVLSERLATANEDGASGSNCHDSDNITGKTTSSSGNTEGKPCSSSGNTKSKSDKAAGEHDNGLSSTPDTEAGYKKDCIFDSTYISKINAALDEIDEYCIKNALVPVFSDVPEELLLTFIKRYNFTKIENFREAADYIYEAEALRNFKGRHYSGQRNHINKFKALYPDYKYRELREGEDLSEFWRKYYGISGFGQEAADVLNNLHPDNGQSDISNRVSSKVEGPFSSEELQQSNGSEALLMKLQPGAADGGSSVELQQSDGSSKFIHTSDAGTSFLQERAVAMSMARRHGEFSSFATGAIEINGEIAAFCIGEILGNRLIVHIEKALTEYSGIYPLLVSEFLKHLPNSIRYVNREDDSNDRGLRISKLQYRPCKILSKYVVLLQSELLYVNEVPLIKTPRLELSEIKEADAAVYQALCLDDERNRYWGYDYRDDLEAEYREGKPLPADYFLRVAQNDFAERMCLNLAVRLDGRMIGELVLYEADYKGGIEAGCRMFAEYEGRGFGREAMEAASDWALYSAGFRYVKARCFKENTASFKMLSAFMKKTGEDGQFIYFEKNC